MLATCGRSYMASSISSDEELENGFSATIVAAGDAIMTLELVLPAGTHPGQSVSFETPAGECNMVVPPGVVPGHPFRVDVAPGSGAGTWGTADATLPSRSTDSSDRTGSSDDRSGSSDDGLADADGSWSLRDVSAKILNVDDAKVTIELVVPAGVPPGALVRFKAPVGMPDGMPAGTMTVTTPPELGLGRKVFVCAPRPAAAAPPAAPARSDDGSECSHRSAGSSDDGVMVMDGHPPGSAQSSECSSHMNAVRECVLRLYEWHGSQRKQHSDSLSQQARAELLEELSKMIASDESLREASTFMDADTVLEYLHLFWELKMVDPEAAQIILAALQSELSGASPLQAIQGQDVIVHNDTDLHGKCGNFVGFDIDSGRSAAAQRLPTPEHFSDARRARWQVPSLAARCRRW